MDDSMMSAVVISGPREAAVQRVPRWALGAGEVSIVCKAAAVCTVERQLFQGARRLYPVIGGHEVSGVVEKVADADCTLQPGDTVVLDAVIRCGQCHYCRLGQDHLCSELRRGQRHNGFVRIGGGFAEYTIVRASRAIKVPKELSFEEACLIEPLSCCLHSIKKGGLNQAQTLAVVGVGTMGALHLLLARTFGARTIAIDVSETRLAAVRQFGTEVLIDATKVDPVAMVKDHTDGRGADVVIVTAGQQLAGEQGIAMAAPAGRVVLYASCHPSRPLSIDWNRIHYEEICITGAAGKTEQDFYEAARLVSERKVDVQPLISKTIGLSELPDELALDSPANAWRVVVKH